MNVKEYLTSKSKPFKVMTHIETGSAQQRAAVLHIPGSRVCKTVLVQLDRGFRYAVAVLPATHKIDLKRLSQMLSGATVELVPEDKLHEHCSDCEVGSVPPFGTKYGMITLVDESLTTCDEITVEGNTLCESIRMSWNDFEDLEHPLVGCFAVPCEES
ncbi:MAG: YbaK/EbsC family protein [Planctomycetota bacterium]|nr:YbaK/EbsC family protein [Planctomycetota bacterium]MDA1213506.1 YbaK/EbsC family protein [Planctomycetota bacterium]